MTSSITIHLSLTSSPSTARSSLAITPTTTSNELRNLVSKLTNVPLDQLKLIFRGRMINNNANKDDGGEEGNVIEEYKLEEGSVVHVMGKPVVVVNNNNNESIAAVASNSASNSSNNQTAGASVTLPNNNNLSSTAATFSFPAATLSSSSATGGVVVGGALEAAITKLRSQNDGTTFRTAVTTVDKLLGNVINNPMEEKYRSIKKSNPAFSKRLGSLVGGHELLLAAGFTIETTKQDDDSIEYYYTLVPSETAWPTLVKAKEEVGKLLLSEVNARNQTVASASTGGGLGSGGWDGTGVPPTTVTGGLGAPGSRLPSFGSGMGGGQQPDMAQMQSMLSDPNMMQRVMSMANNPMVQQMMQNDPRFANNPMLQQLQALQSNPDMLNQMSSMMANPQARQRMASMVAQQAAATQQQQQQQGGTSGAAASGGTDPFANGMRDQFQQMQNQSGGLTPEQLQRMMSQFGNMGGNGGATTSVSAPSNGNSGGSTTNNNNTSNYGGSNGASSSGGETEMTEEEMINEAIARSLRES